RINIDQLYSGGVSDPRNPYLQKMFQLIGLGEKAGSGFVKILRAWQEQSWLKPLVSERTELDVTIVILPFLSMIPRDVNNYLRKLLGNEYKSLNELQRLILVLAHQFSSTTNQDIAHYTSVHSHNIGYELAKMVARGWLSSAGIGRGTRYSLAIEDAGNVKEYDNDIRLADNQHVIDESHKSLSHKSLSHKSLSHKSLSHKSLSMLNVRNSPANSIVEQVRNSKRIKPDLLVQAILDVCLDDFCTCEIIARTLNRTEKTLRNSFLPKMVKQGILVLRYPKQPNHPQQAYKTL